MDELKEDQDAGKDVRLNLTELSPDLEGRLDGIADQSARRKRHSRRPGRALVVPAGLMAKLRGDEPVARFPQPSPPMQPRVPSASGSP